MSHLRTLLPRLSGVCRLRTVTICQKPGTIFPTPAVRYLHVSRLIRAEPPSPSDSAVNESAKKSSRRADATSKAPGTELVVDASKGDGILCIGLNCPDVKNALGVNLMKQLAEVIDKLKEDESTRVVIVHSLVPGAFCAGANLKERVGMDESDVGPFVSRARALIHRLYELPQPTLCAIDGIALGGGLEMALACDLRAASNDAVMGLVETRLAILPGAGGTQRLPRIIGVNRAKEMIFLGRRINGEEAARIGLVNWNVPQNASGTAAFELCLEHARTLATKAGPLALRWSKVAIDRGLEQTNWNDALDMEDMCYSQIISTEDRREGLKAFMEKRPPQYKGV